jgi:hypothetical protein
MAAFAALQALARTDRPWPAAEAVPLPSRREQEMMLAAVPMP